MLNSLQQAIQTAPGAHLFANLNPLDWALLLILGTSVIAAFLKGLVRSLISLIGVIAGSVLALYYTPDAGRYLHRWVPDLSLAEIVAFVAILAATCVMAALLGRVVRGACKAAGLGFLDRLAGASFGFVRAALVLSALLIPAAPYLTMLPLTRDSILLPYLRTAAHGISFVMPRDFANRLPAGAALWKQPGTGRRSSQAMISPESLPEPGNAEGDAQ